MSRLVTVSAALALGWMTPLPPKKKLPLSQPKSNVPILQNPRASPFPFFLSDCLARLLSFDLPVDVVSSVNYHK